jgi:formate hydrogenlyase subunit 3/multisubunit Na+/H+ antiporter MnhD subunit
MRNVGAMLVLIALVVIFIAYGMDVHTAGLSAADAAERFESRELLTLIGVALLIAGAVVAGAGAISDALLSLREDRRPDDPAS